jgi:hypothetical protein
MPVPFSDGHCESVVESAAARRNAKLVAEAEGIVHFLLFSLGQFAFSQPPEFGRFAPGHHFETKGADY